MKNGEGRASSVQLIVDEVRGLLASHDIEAAKNRLAGALMKHPNNLRLKLVEGNILEKYGDTEGARAHYAGLTETFPKSPQPNFRLARLAVMQRDYSEAAKCLRHADDKGLSAERSQSMCLKIAKHSPDLVASRQMLEKKINATMAPTEELLGRLAHTCVELKDCETAYAVTARIFAINPDSVSAHAHAAKAAIILGDAERAEAEYVILQRLEPENPRWVADAMRFYSMIGENDRAVRLLRSALNRGMASELLAQEARRLRLPADMAAKIPARLEIGVVDAANTRHQVTGNTRKVAAQLAASDLFADAPADAALKRPLVVVELDKEVMFAPATEPDAVVLVFAGLADRAMVPIEIFDRYLAAMNMTAVYLRDTSRLLFNDGVPSIPGKFAGAVDYLKKYLAEIHSDRLITLGTSAGGYAALRYGLALGAERIVCFSAPTNLTASFLAEDGRGRLVAKRLQNLPADTLDIRPAVQAAAAKSDIHLVFGEQAREDRRHALYLQGAPGVTLHELPNVEVHGSLTVLARERKLNEFLRIHLRPRSGDEIS